MARFLKRSVGTAQPTRAT